MREHIGIVRVNAEKVWRIKRLGDEPPNYLEWVADRNADKHMPPDATAEVGYMVEVCPGFMNFMTEEAFKLVYRPTEGMTFGEAIDAAKAGKRIARKGWNGKSQFVELGRDFQYTCDASDIPGSVAVQHTDIGSKALVFVGTRGRQAEWLASQADMLADDWYIVE